MKTIYISGEIGWDVTPDDIREQIDPTSKEKLRVIINSPGGYISDGIEIYNLLKSYKGEIEVIIGAMAASAASYIACVAPFERRKAFKNSSFMIHEAVCGIYGRARDLAIYADYLEGLNNIFAETYAEELKITKDAARDKMREDCFFIGWESLTENNIISDVIDQSEIEIPQKEESNRYSFFYMKLIEDLNKESDLHTLKAKIQLTEEKIKNDYQKNSKEIAAIAAYLNSNNQKINNENKKLKEEESMTLQEFLKTNSDANAEFDKLLIAAEQRGNSAKADLDGERERIAGILKLADVALQPNVILAIENGISDKDFAVAELQRRKEAGKNQSSPFAALNPNRQTPGEQDPDGAAEQKGDATAIDPKLPDKVKNTLEKGR